MRNKTSAETVYGAAGDLYYYYPRHKPKLIGFFSVLPVSLLKLPWGPE